MQLNNATKKAHAFNRNKKLHIVQNKKAQFSHLTTEKDEIKCSIVYNLSRKEQREKK